MKKHLIIILLAIVGLFLGMNGFAQEKKGPEMGGTEGPRIKAFMAGKIIGSKVINSEGATLGKIGNLVVDIDTGRILYAVLDAGGFLGIGSKLFPVPWESLAALPSEGIFFLNQSKEQMEKAPAFDEKNLPSMGDMQWGWGLDILWHETILRHYGVPGYEQGEPTGHGYAYVPYYGRGYHGPPKEDPYNTFFDSKTIKTISGQVIKVDQVPEPGVGLEVRLTVFIDQKEVLPVYLGPTFYVDPPQVKHHHFNLGDKVTVTGSQVTLRGESLMLAMTVKRGNEVLQLRDKAGIPQWIGWKKTSD